MSTVEPHPTEVLVLKRHVRPIPEINRVEGHSKVGDKLEEIGKHLGSLAEKNAQLEARNASLQSRLCELNRLLEEVKTERHDLWERQKLKQAEEREEVEQRDLKVVRDYYRVQMENKEMELTALRKIQFPGPTAGVAAPLQSSTSVNIQPMGEEQGSSRVHRVGVPGNKRGRPAPLLRRAEPKPIVSQSTVEQASRTLAYETAPTNQQR
ncbi:hypothetical protein QFC20_007325 [Naganishia adeliensis]|uniref:Uncharacterized protein n=1 Tax=Naganishia adeliensis TaxID=92952 RepID=A0ACC2V162_9TREE|nr:hypothetical protein QFC20_007325 [Naganishia adeliensis]